MKKILIIASTNLKNDPRVYRQIYYLRKHYHVTTVGKASPGLEDVEFHEISPIIRSRLARIKRAFAYKLRRFEAIYWSLYDFQPLLEVLGKRRFDLILANDLDTLPFALEIANRAKVLLDVHEYAPRHFEDQLIWRFFFQPFNEYLCATYMKQCDGVIATSTGIANEYKKNYGIDPQVITNAVEYVELRPGPVNPGNIRIITHGIANPSRRLELMIYIMDYLDPRFHLDLMLMPASPGYYKRLKTLAARRSNVSVIPPVTREEIVPVTNKYDLSFLVFKPYTITLRYGTFNKFYESLQARLGIVTGPTPQPQVEIVNKYGCGIVLDSFEPKRIAVQLNQLTAEQIEGFKKNAHLAARELTSQKNMEKLEEIVNRLIKPA